MWNTHLGVAVGGWSMIQWPQESLSNCNNYVGPAVGDFNDPMASGISVTIEHPSRCSHWRMINDPMASEISVKLEHPVRSNFWRLVSHLHKKCFFFFFPCIVLPPQLSPQAPATFQSNEFLPSPLKVQCSREQSNLAPRGLLKP